MPELIWNSSCGKIELEFKSIEQVYDMSHPGDCEESVKAEYQYFKEQLSKIELLTICNVLSEVFADDTAAELMLESTEDLHIKLLWIAACDLRDQENMEELCRWQNDFLAEKRRD